MIRITDILSRNSAQYPDSAAITYKDHTYTWSQLERRIYQIASGLLDMGVQPGDRTAYLGLNSHRQFEFLFAPSLAGAISSPINFRQSVREMVECINDFTPNVLFVDRTFLETARQVIQECPSIRHVIFADDGECPKDMIAYDSFFEAGRDANAGTFENVASSDGDTFILFYTSGSTGQPKGVMLSHQNLYMNAFATRFTYGMDPGKTHLMSGPMFHLASGGRAFSAAMSYGHTVIIPKFDVEAVMAAAETYRINVILLVPTMLSMVLNHPRFKEFDLASVELITYGAAPMPAALIERALKELPGVNFLQGYGMTEASPLVTVLPRDHHFPGHPGMAKLKSVGLPVPHADVRIINESGEFLPTGEIGEVAICGPQIMSGYWNNPEATAQAFHGRFYLTGDAGYLDEDGYLFLSGRQKEMIITGGENVYPIETENALSHHPDVVQCAVIGQPDDHWGERVHAVIRLTSGSSANEKDLTNFCREFVAGYKCPRSYTFLEQPFPMTATDKIDKAALRTVLCDENNKEAIF